MPYGHTITLELALSRRRRQGQGRLRGSGFGILTEIDGQATLKQKLGQDTDPM